MLLRNAHHIPCKCAQKILGHDQYITKRDGIRTERPEIDSGGGYFYLLSVQTGSGIHPAKWVLAGVKAAGE
jgi:hypothetical protein